MYDYMPRNPWEDDFEREGGPDTDPLPKTEEPKTGCPCCGSERIADHEEISVCCNCGADVDDPNPSPMSPSLRSCCGPDWMCAKHEAEDRAKYPNAVPSEVLERWASGGSLPAIDPADVIPLGEGPSPDDCQSCGSDEIDRSQKWPRCLACGADADDPDFFPAPYPISF